MIYTARIQPKHLRDTDGCDPKVLLQGVYEGLDMEQFRDHCYVSINKNKELKELVRTTNSPVLIRFNAKVHTYGATQKQTLGRIKNIKILGRA